MKNDVQSLCIEVWGPDPHGMNMEEIRMDEEGQRGRRRRQNTFSINGGLAFYE